MGILKLMSTTTTTMGKDSPTLTILVVRQMAPTQRILIVGQGARFDQRTQLIQRPQSERVAPDGGKFMESIALSISKKTDSLLEPNLHDGNLLGIGLPREGSAELIVAEMSGKKYRIVLDGVFRFLATNVRQGNIILDVTIAQGESVQIADLEALVDVGPDGERLEKYLRAIHERVLRESLFVLELNPSYGCHLIAIAKTIFIFREDDLAT